MKQTTLAYRKLNLLSTSEFSTIFTRLLRFYFAGAADILRPPRRRKVVPSMNAEGSLCAAGNRYMLSINKQSSSSATELIRARYDV